MSKSTKILTILGTRPEIIRLSRIIPKLDKFTTHHVLHTGQNYTSSLNDIFFKELRLRKPNHVIDSKADTFSEQLSKIFSGVEKYVTEFKPDKVLILGDTNSGLSSIIVERMGIPVYHMEAGNRCYDLEVPEEKNRKVIDAISSFNLPYTRNSFDILLREGRNESNTKVTGNPIGEVIDFYQPDIDRSTIIKDLGLNADRYTVVTAHRAENVDNAERLGELFHALTVLSQEQPVVFSCHPRTAQKLEQFNIKTGKIKILEPLGFFDFVKLESFASLIVTDSGTVSEEGCILKVPVVTSRNSTERPETVKVGANRVGGVTSDGILSAAHAMKVRENNWTIPDEYTWSDVSDLVVNLLVNYNV